MSQLSSSKLFIRSEVLSVINMLMAVDNTSKQDKVKQLKRLQALPDQETVQQVLVKELQRATQPHQIQVITELMMELGSIDVLKDPLWAMIEDAKSPDEIKDAANLVLRQLGDQSDPNLYLDYLEDPAGLISRETERMLEVSTRNPEALVDFLDFIFSLPVEEQCSLLSSLHEDYPAEYLLNILIPALEAQPPLEAQELILAALGQIRLPQSAIYLQDWLQRHPETTLDSRLRKAAKKSVNELRIGGVYKEDQMEAYQAPLHPITEVSTIYQCFATIPDGIGNQGIIVSRERENGDIVMISVAVNDIHGVMDCFGFYELGRSDFHKIAEKFHEESTKIHASPEYCLTVLSRAEALNRKNHFRIPYEYSCWKVLMDDVTAMPASPEAMCESWAKPGWDSASANLYQHPDFSTWFLEEGDHPVVTQAMQGLNDYCVQWVGSEASPQEGLQQLEAQAVALVHSLLKSDWREVLMRRLAETAYLMNRQQANTFCTLAATAMMSLKAYQPDQGPIGGFMRQYGRRCIEEGLLRLRQNQYGQNPRFNQLVETALAAWAIE